MPSPKSCRPTNSVPLLRELDLRQSMRHCPSCTKTCIGQRLANLSSIMRTNSSASLQVGAWWTHSVNVSRLSRIRASLPFLRAAHFSLIG